MHYLLSRPPSGSRQIRNMSPSSGTKATSCGNAQTSRIIKAVIHSGDQTSRGDKCLCYTGQSATCTVLSPKPTTGSDSSLRRIQKSYNTCSHAKINCKSLKSDHAFHMRLCSSQVVNAEFVVLDLRWRLVDVELSIICVGLDAKVVSESASWSSSRISK